MRLNDARLIIFQCQTKHEKEKVLPVPAWWFVLQADLRGTQALRALLTAREQTSTMKQAKNRLTTVIECPQLPACWSHRGGCTVRSPRISAQASLVLTRTRVSIADPKVSKFV